ncbi:MAG: T9SS type A sorting domain-containing protein [Nonlabens sp.]|uniref:T9SS type A sorting domain-containing protein n=1 Tax=Nonlabens sp. TaxID=1888209 RepID=UPI003EF150D6
MNRICILFLVFALSMSSWVTAQVTTTLNSALRDMTALDIGFNRRSDPGSWWTDNSFQNLLTQINPDVLRYPGGTQANYWEWQTGKFLDNTDKNWNNKEVLTIPGFVNAIPSGTKVVYVVNIARPTSATGISVNAPESVLKSTATLNAKITDMLAALAEFDTQGNLPYAVELGNEFYFGNIESGIFEIKEINGVFYSGWNPATNAPYQSTSKQNATDITAAFYVEQCKAIVTAIKAQYPNMKIAMCTTKSGNGTSARDRWNNTIITELANNPSYSTLASQVDALTQHHYLNTSYGVQTVISDNQSSKVAIAEGIEYPLVKQSDYNLVPSNYELWLTEYGEVKGIAEETWADAVRYAALNYSWLSLGDKITQLHFHHLTDNTVIKVGSPMKLAPVGVAAKLFQQAAAGMTQMQFVNFSNNPISVNNVNALYGIKFKNTQKETLLIINTDDSNVSSVQFGNLFDYTGTQTLTRYHSNAPYVAGVSEGDSNIVFNNSTVNNSETIRKFSINVIEVQNTLSVDDALINTIQMYPNPAKDVIKFKSNSNIETAAIYAMDGTQVLVSKLENNQFDVSSLASGFYLIQIKHSEGITTLKLVKE